MQTASETSHTLLVITTSKPLSWKQQHIVGTQPAHNLLDNTS